MKDIILISILTIGLIVGLKSMNMTKIDNSVETKLIGDGVYKEIEYDGVIRANKIQTNYNDYYKISFFTVLSIGNYIIKTKKKNSYKVNYKPLINENLDF